MPDLTVLTIAYRAGYIDSMVQALRAQTLDKDQWEWILVDDRWADRKDAVREFIGDSINYRHLPPREVKPYSATGIAINTGLGLAQGKLVYFMADYMYPHPKCLERHWEVYQKFGPRVMVSGPVVDSITVNGKSIWGPKYAMAWQMGVRVGDEVIQYPEHMPPLQVDIQDHAEIYSADKAISVWKKPFHPHWPAAPGLDWRMGALLLGGRGLAPDLLQYCGEPGFWFAGRNDSAGLDVLRESGGLQEEPVGQHGGLEVLWEQRMRDLGAKYLVDQRAPAMLLPHPFRKPEVPGAG